MGAPKMPVVLSPDSEKFKSIVSDLEQGKSRLEVVDVVRLGQEIHWIFGVTAVCTFKTPEGNHYSPQLLHSHVVGAQTVLPVIDLLGDPKIKVNRRQRNAMAAFDVYRKFWEDGYTVNPRDVYQYLGSSLIELPRGVPEPEKSIYVASEAAEELGLEVKHSILMGNPINPDPGIFMTGLLPFCAVMSEKESELDEREAVHFEGELFIRPEDALEKIDTDDGITLATIRRARKILPKLERGDGMVPESMTDEELEALIDFGKRLT